jgi:uncharacterized UBP type Zn finger protein
MKRVDCSHQALLREETTSTKDRCEACGLTQDLRLCLTCGYVGCCESHAAHDTEHFRKSGHPFIRPHASNKTFLWCYACNAFLE